MARPRIEFTDKDWANITGMAGIHCTGEEIAAVLGVDYDTLKARIEERYGVGFSEWYKKASSTGKTSLRRFQYKAAEKGNIPMLIWLGKQWLGQRDKALDEDEKDPPSDPSKIPMSKDDILDLVRAARSEKEKDA